MKNLIKKINLEKLGIFSFLLFFLFTPLLVKVRVAEGVYVEPLLPFLAAAVGFFLLSFYRSGRSTFLERVKGMFLPNGLAALYLVFIAFLLMSFGYGYVATGFFSTGDLLRLVKYALYFLPFPLAVYVGRRLGRKDVNDILAIFVAVGIATAIASFLRIYLYLDSGGAIDFWTYNVYNRSIGFLGQYFDPFWLTLGSTGRSAGGTYGLYASVVLGVFLGLVSRAKAVTRSRFFWSTLAVVVVFGAVLYTLSRGAVLVATLVIAGWLVWSWKSHRLKLAILSMLIVALANIFLIGANPQVYRKFASTISLRVSEVTDSLGEPADPDTEVVFDSSTVGRFQRWEKILEMFRKEPAFVIFGVGYNTKNLQHFADVGSTHSFFLDMWARGGLTALFLAIAVWILLFKTVFGFLFSRDAEVRMLGFPLLGFAFGWLIDNLISGEQFFSDAPMIAFWGVLGLVEALRQIDIKADRHKKVLIALTSADPGGAPQVVYDLLSRARSKDFEFVVAAPQGVFLQKFRNLGYKVFPIRLDRISLTSFRKFLKVASRERVDLINSHGKGAGLYARKVGFILDVPVVQTFHGLWYEYPNRIAKFLYINLEKLLSLFTKLIINVSATQQREGLAMGLFQRFKSRVVVNGVDTAVIDRVKAPKTVFRTNLGLDQGDFVVTMAARFVPQKGHERLVRMLPDILEKVPNLKIVFAGDGELRRPIERLSKKLGVSSAVRFLGQRPDVFKILKISDASILPSYREGLPLTVLEAMACRLPVVGSDVVGIRDLVKNGETGYLMDFDDRAEVVKALRQLGKSKELRQRMGERGRQFVEEKFPMEKFVKNTLAVYQESLE